MDTVVDCDYCKLVPLLRELQLYFGRTIAIEKEKKREREKEGDKG